MIRALVVAGLVLLILIELFAPNEHAQLGHADPVNLVAKAPSVNPYAAQVSLGPDFLKLISYKPHARSGPLRHAVEAVGGIWNAISQCEAHGIWNTNTGNGYFGGLQEDMGFWVTYGPHRLDKDGNDLGLVAPRPDLASPADQITAATRARDGYAGNPPRGYHPWPTCAARLGLI